MIPGFTYSTNPGGPGAIISQGPIQTGPGGFLPGDTNSYNAGLGQSKAAYYGSLFPSLASFGRNFADAYGSMAGGASNVAQAMANESVGRMGALGMAEAARQTAAGNIGSSALGAYGGAANSALNAWAQNQSAYNQAAASMHNANQQAMSNYGVSRNGALQGLGQSYADMTGRLGAANQLTNIGGGFGDSGMGGGGGFTAAGPSGLIASGSYGGGGFSGGNTSFGGSKGPGPGFDQIASSGFGGLNSLQRNVMSPDITRSIDSRASAGMRQLDNQHYSSRMMPSQMLNQSLSGMQQLGRQGYGQLSSGMNQFYSNANQGRPDFGGVLQMLGSGYNNANNQMNNFWTKGFQPLTKYA